MSIGISINSTLGLGNQAASITNPNQASSALFMFAGYVAGVGSSQTPLSARVSVNQNPYIAAFASSGGGQARRAAAVLSRVDVASNGEYGIVCTAGSDTSVAQLPFLYSLAQLGSGAGLGSFVTGYNQVSDGGSVGVNVPRQGAPIGALALISTEVRVPHTGFVAITAQCNGGESKSWQFYAQGPGPNGGGVVYAPAMLMPVTPPAGHNYSFTLSTNSGSFLTCSTTASVVELDQGTH